MERKFVISLFRFSCGRKRGENKSKKEGEVGNGEERKEWRGWREYRKKEVKGFQGKTQAKRG